MDLAGLDRVLGDLAERRWLQGAVALAGADGTVVERALGYADVAARVPFAPTTAADAGSVVKPMTATLVWSAVAEGVLAPEDPVARYLPGFPATIRVVDLITHRTGRLPDYDWYAERLAPGGVLTNQALADLTVRERWQPATDAEDRFDYDSPGFDLAAAVLAAAYDEPYADLLARRITGPLGMDDTVVRPALLADWAGPRTRGYAPTADGWADCDVEDGEGFHGGSNVWTSARDLLAWVRAFLDPARAPLDPATLARAEQPVRYPGGAVGALDHLSWYVGDAGVRHYPGVLRGFFAVGLLDRRHGVALALVSNGHPPQWLRQPLVRLLHTVAAGGPALAPVPPPPRERDLVADDVLGHYRGGAGGAVEVVPDGEGVRLRPAGGPSYAVFRLEPEHWYVPGLDHYLSWSNGGRRLHVETVGGAHDLVRR